MSHEYVCQKIKFNAKEFCKAQIFFRNGDYFELLEGEIVEIDIQFYDTLVAGELGFCPVAKSGFIKCKIKEKTPKYCHAFVYNQKEWAKNRKEYLERRCVNEGGIYYLRLFDHNNWHYGIYAETVARLENGYLILRFQENKTYGLADKEYHTVNACNLTKSLVEKISLDFENCDGFDIYPEEIQEMNINFEKHLKWTSSCFGREIKNGFIRLKLNKELTWRHVNVYNCKEKIPNIKKLERRLCGRGIDDCDICHLYVWYNYAGYCMNHEECIHIEDIRPIEELPDVDEEDIYPCFISGYAKREDDGSILIVFGKSKEEA